MRAVFTRSRARSFLVMLSVMICLLCRHQPLSAQTASPTPTPNNSSNDAEIDAKKRKVEEIQQKLKEIEGQKISLSSTLQYITTKVNLSQAEIDKTQAEISSLERQVKDLSTRINGLEQSLDVLSDVLVNRVSHTYKQRQTHPLQLLLLSHRMTEFMTQLRYQQIIQEQTRLVMAKAESQKVNFDEQKNIKEEKQDQVEKKKSQLQQQQSVLTQQRREQQVLLDQTKNDESKYQAELAKTLAELEAIQGIISGKGNETKVRSVKQGEQIASIIVGASPCSTGTHLHFEVVRSGAHQNPAGYLKNIAATWSNSPDGSFSFSGDWEWPVHDPARINQGYGMTYYARVRRAYGGAPHTGIDMVSKSSGNTGVNAVKDGELYRGGIACGKGTLRYVRVIHPDGLSTYYLHVNY